MCAAGSRGRKRGRTFPDVDLRKRPDPRARVRATTCEHSWLERQNARVDEFSPGAHYSYVRNARKFSSLECHRVDRREGSLRESRATRGRFDQRRRRRRPWPRRQRKLTIGSRARAACAYVFEFSLLLSSAKTQLDTRPLPFSAVGCSMMRTSQRCTVTHAEKEGPSKGERNGRG